MARSALGCEEQGQKHLESQQKDYNLSIQDKINNLTLFSDTSTTPEATFYYGTIYIIYIGEIDT